MASAHRWRQPHKAQPAKATAGRADRQIDDSAPLAPDRVADLRSLSPASVLQLQRRSGNVAVQALVRRAQAATPKRPSAGGLRARPAAPDKPSASRLNPTVQPDADVIAWPAARDSAIAPPGAEHFGPRPRRRMGRRIVQRKGGKAKGAHSAGVSLRKDDLVDYDETGEAFKKQITIKAINRKACSPPIVVMGIDAVNLKNALEDYDGAVAAEEGTSAQKAKVSDEARLENVREKTAVTGNENPDLEEGIENSFFTKPKAIRVDRTTGDIKVEMDLRTYNRWDRVTWSCRVGSKEDYVLLPDDKSWWSNPAWDRSRMYAGYGFRNGADVSQMKAQGTGLGGTRRKIRTVVPGAYVKQIFGNDLSGLKKSSIICFGMEVYYGGPGPTTATREEFTRAYDVNVATAHQYGLNATSTPESYGYVDLSGTDLPEGEWLTEEEVWAQDIEDNPSPNIKLPMPPDYANAKLIEALTPKGGMQIATRIENEATLKVSSLERLTDIRRYLEGLSEHPEEVTALMKGDSTLEKFNWSITPDQNSDVFTDVYLDDVKHTALRAGVGIRKRWTPKATKLNVKTGPGYHVGALGPDDKESETVKSDTYRRHEIGYDLRPDAQISDISAFLAAGAETYDPWNRGAEQASQALPEGQQIDFKHLQGTMVLKGDRRKFNLKAVSKETGSAINIEISCDHTVGRTYQDYEKMQDPTDLFDATAHYARVFNVEMELEHLGAGAKTETQPTGESGGQVGKGATTSKTAGSSQRQERQRKAPKKQPLPGHPGRLYMRADAANPKFNTRSFEVFAKAHNRMITALQLQLKDNTELAEDKQKLENLFTALFPGDVRAYGKAIERRKGSS